MGSLTSRYSPTMGFPLRCAVMGLLGLSACAPPESPQWIHLARVLPAGAGDLRQTLELEAHGLQVRLEPAPDGAWMSTEIRREDWEWREGMGLWGADVPIQGVGIPPDGSPPQRLLADGVERRHFPISQYTRTTELEPGSFLTRRGRILLRVADGEEPPRSARLSLYVARGRRGAEAWRVRGQRFSGEGFSVWPGETWSVPVRLVAPCELRFATCVEPGLEEGGVGGQVRFVVEVDGETVFEHVEESDRPRSAWHAVSLPPKSGPVEVGFRVEGPWASTAFLAPVVVPKTVPEQSRRPDLIVFLADTFRADNLAAYGGTLDLTPHMDRFAESSLRFRRAWSVATRTLPAHASLLGGVFPRQAGVRGASEALPEELVTVAEVLSRAGYRTGAVTDSVIVSQKFGMDQGFEWFDEEHGTFESTLERVRSFLDADDGRPVFLFIQSYRAHTPYVASDETRKSVGARLGLEGEYEDWSERLKHEVLRSDAPDLDSELARGIIAQIERHYRAGVHDLDRGFGQLEAELGERGLLDSGYFVVTSDHGEAFREHDALYHGGRVWEELIRIPLLATGPGLEPGDVQRPVSLVDLPATLVAWAGLPRPSEWVGRPLLAGEDARAVFAFQCWREPSASTVAVIDGGRKLIGSEDLETLASEGAYFAFDLEADPRELDNLLESHPSWQGSLVEESLGALEVLMAPLYGTRAAELDPEKRAQLRAMGYGD